MNAIPRLRDVRTSVRHAVESKREGDAGSVIGRGVFPAGPKTLFLPHDLVLLKKPKSREAEQFRLLRTRLLTTHGDKLGLFSVIGSGAASRADYVAANLAASFAQMKKRVLLIDADLRRPRLQSMFRLAPGNALAAALEGASDLADVAIETPVENFALLPSGARRSDPQGLLAAESLRRLLDEARARYDIVLVLTPRLGPVADGQLVLAETKAAIVVVRRDHARLTDVKDTQAVLRQLGVDTFGAVLTR